MGKAVLKSNITNIPDGSLPHAVIVIILFARSEEEKSAKYKPLNSVKLAILWMTNI